MEGIKDMSRLYFFNGSAEGEKIGKIPSGVVWTELGVMAAASSRAAVAS